MEFARLLYILCLYSLLISCDATTSVVHDGLAHQKGDTTAERAARIKIKVFRSPMKEERGEEYAAWGFWVQQPAGLS